MGLFTVLREPPTQALTEKVTPCLTDTGIPLDIRLDSLAILFRCYRGDEGYCARLAEWFANKAPDKLVGIDLLRKVEQRIGKTQVIDEVCQSLSDRINFRCPCCQIRLVTPLMREHLWNEHHLILDGKHAREPWRMVQELLDDYLLDRKEDHLKRSLEVVNLVDPKDGKSRLLSLLRKRGIDDLFFRALGPRFS